MKALTRRGITRRLSVATLLVAAGWPMALRAGAATGTFTNPIRAGSDPWVVRHEKNYFWSFTEENRGVALHQSERLSTLGEKHVVWRAPASGPHSSQIWAPELHFLDGRAYIYCAASDGNNATHRMIVLESTSGPLGPYALKSELYTGDDLAGRTNNRWAIDGTVLELRGQRYFLWSGWADERDHQFLYIARLANPWTLATARVRLCANDDFDWERVEETRQSRGLNEAPQVLQRDGRTFVVYSASASWRASYKLGLLELQPGADPLEPRSWRKHAKPVFASSEQTFGVGHGAFVHSPDGREWWHTYHVKVDRADGWKRTVFLQPFTWSAAGYPDFGAPVAAGVELALPAGETRERKP